MNITKKSLFIGIFWLCQNMLELGSITLNTRTLFAIISCLIMTVFKKIVVVYPRIATFCWINNGENPHVANLLSNANNYHYAG